MRSRKLGWLAPAAVVGGMVFQSCTVLVPYPTGPFTIDLRGGIPHFDGDGEDSFLDRLFGFDDDDDDDDRYDD
jgi:hypothetical protein